VPHFDEEKIGMFKADICRVAALFEACNLPTIPRCTKSVSNALYLPYGVIVFDILLYFVLGPI